MRNYNLKTHKSSGCKSSKRERTENIFCNLWCVLFGPFLREDLLFTAATLKSKVFQNVAVLFDSLTREKIHVRCRSCFSTLLLIFMSSFIHASVIWCHSHSILEPWGGVHCSLLTPPLAWVMGQALGGAARCIFPWSKPWLCMGTELGDLQTRRHMVESFHQWYYWLYWMNASIFPPQAALNLCLCILYFLVFLCFGGRDRAVVFVIVFNCLGIFRIVGLILQLRKCYSSV